MGNDTVKIKNRPAIVRAWFDTVINPLLHGLSRERELLKEGNWTFRFYKRRFDELAPVKEYLHQAGSENLKQFLGFFPEGALLIQKHDQGIDRLREACIELFERIRTNAAFRREFEAIAAESASLLNKDFASNFGASFSPEDQQALLAEYLVNGIQNLPEYYTTHRLWAAYGARLASVLREHPIAEAQSFCAQKGQSLLSDTASLAALLDQVRSDLSLDNDVPFALPSVT